MAVDIKAGVGAFFGGVTGQSDRASGGGMTPAAVAWIIEIGLLATLAALYFGFGGLGGDVAS